jgi:hypothetical protein
MDLECICEYTSAQAKVVGIFIHCIVHYSGGYSSMLQSHLIPMLCAKDEWKGPQDELEGAISIR